MAVGIGLSLQADYLYWMVDTDSAAKYEPYTAVRLTDGTKTIDEYEFTGASELVAYQEQPSGYFTAVGTFDSSQSFFVELLNGSTWTAQSAPKTYAQLLDSGSIFKSGSIAPATASAASSPTAATSWALAASRRQ